MDLQKKKENNQNQRSRVILIAVIFTITAIFFYILFVPNDGILNLLNIENCSTIETKIKDIAESVDSNKVVKLSSLTEYKWSEFYILDGPMFSSEVEKLIGLKYNNTINDDCHQLIFIDTTKKQIINESSSSCRNIDWSQFTFNKGYAKFDSLFLFYIKKIYLDDYRISYKIVDTVQTVVTIPNGAFRNNKY